MRSVASSKMVVSQRITYVTLIPKLAKKLTYVTKRMLFLMIVARTQDLFAHVQAECQMLVKFAQLPLLTTMMLARKSLWLALVEVHSQGASDHIDLLLDKLTR